MSRWRMPLWVALALPFGGVLLTAIGILIGAQRLTSARLIEASGRNLLFATSDHMRAEVLSHLNVIYTLQLSMADLLTRQDLVHAGDMSAVQTLFSGHFKSIYRPHFPQVGMIQLGTEHGDFFGIKIGPDGRLQTFLKDRRTAQRLISYDTDSGAEQAVIQRYDPRQRPWYTPAARLGQPRWTEVYVSSFGDSASISATTPRPNSIAYTATKHAVSGLTKTASLDGRKYDIAVGQIDIGNAATDMAMRMAKGVLQANGEVAVEPLMDVNIVGQSIVYMASLPLEVNVMFHTVMATKMPFAGRG